LRKLPEDIKPAFEESDEVTEPALTYSRSKDEGWGSEQEKRENDGRVRVEVDEDDDACKVM
jgi:hypothetical protein